MRIPFDNRYVTLGQDFFERTDPTPVKKPELIKFNDALAGELGMQIDLGRIPLKEDLSPARILYSESCGRFIVTTAPEKAAAFEDIMSGLSFGMIGKVTDSKHFTVTGPGNNRLMDLDIDEMKGYWKRPFGDLI